MVKEPTCVISQLDAAQAVQCDLGAYVAPVQRQYDALAQKQQL